MSSVAGPGIDTVRRLLRERLPASAIVTEPAEVAAQSRLWNSQVKAMPAVVVHCRTVADVQAAVRAARSAGVPVSVRGGGHDWAGGAIVDGGVLIDLRAMRQVGIEGDVAAVAGGATVSDVLDAARPYGYAAAVGTVSSVGFAGLTLGGGYGTLIGVVGLGVDNLLSAQVVLADGRVVIADPHREPELFWALRGGGANFGVVTELRTRLHPMATVTTGLIAFPMDQARSVLRGWRSLVASACDALDVMFGVMTTPAGKVVFTSPTWSGDPARGVEQMDAVRALGDPVIDDVGHRALADAVHSLDEVFPYGGNYHLSSRTLAELTDEAIDSFIAAAESMPATCCLNVHHSHGEATRVLATDTAYPYRDEHLVIEILGAWPDGDGTIESAWVHDTEKRLEAHAIPGGWANLMAPGDQRVRDAYGINTERLAQAKASYDPEGVFTAIPLPTAPDTTNT
ncbi:FAD-binding oxidoreductase [Amycolatopsis rubida]|uniref:FAD-binding oxidoreductase n=1 Tax=Amycolatopsis rubida TaxID=112413 RepID=A0ABX0BQZ2_9PSEU|nr:MULTISPECIES: FAD-binding oxidoreductase [Amycolatopsis]MYW90759.1 FAD-binding protein [Amycolatopsis rubida]NEC55742.1 FAD-binding oxidoreductase [Amycolatopsis rubida]OAP26186.1 6-hydroxy-D-nicotine oxidase [Amycolatopsis sp. M39]